MIVTLKRYISDGEVKIETAAGQELLKNDITHEAKMMFYFFMLKNICAKSLDDFLPDFDKVISETLE